MKLSSFRNACAWHLLNGAVTHWTLFSPDLHALTPGVAVVGFAAAFVQACNKVSGSLDNVCIDLNFVGIPTIACGGEYLFVCTCLGGCQGGAHFFLFLLISLQMIFKIFATNGLGLKL